MVEYKENKITKLLNLNFCVKIKTLKKRSNDQKN